MDYIEVLLLVIFIIAFSELIKNIKNNRPRLVIVGGYIFYI